MSIGSRHACQHASPPIAHLLLRRLVVVARVRSVPPSARIWDFHATAVSLSATLRGVRMRRTLRLFLCQCLLAGLALPAGAAAQDTRGKISGTVRDKDGVIPGASVKITNTDTSVSQALTT